MKASQKYIKRVEKFNKELREAIEYIGENDFPTIDSTYQTFDPINEIEILRHTKKEVVFKWDDEEYHIPDDDEMPTDEMELDDAMAYERRRIKKGLAVFKSENPDDVLDKYDDNEERYNSFFKI